MSIDTVHNSTRIVLDRFTRAWYCIHVAGDSPHNNHTMRARFTLTRYQTSMLDNAMKYRLQVFSYDDLTDDEKAILGNHEQVYAATDRYISDKQLAANHSN